MCFSVSSPEKLFGMTLHDRAERFCSSVFCSSLGFTFEFVRVCAPARVVCGGEAWVHGRSRWQRDSFGASKAVEGSARARASVLICLYSEQRASRRTERRALCRGVKMTLISRYPDMCNTPRPFLLFCCSR